jgi:mannosyl-3-phosphoglycerate synthase
VRKKVLFTDIDGTLTDIVTGEYSCSKDTIKTLKQLDVPIILCSAKTMAEQELIRQELEILEPFVVENGGAIVLPQEYFDQSVIPEENCERVGNYLVLQLGQPISVIREKLKALRKDSNLKFLTVGDLSVEKLSKVTRLTQYKAMLMANRMFAETILSINKGDLPDFSRRACSLGLRVIYGGQFVDVTGGIDKGKAVRFLIDCFRKKYGDYITFFGIGDSPNDDPMLKEVDVPMLVQRPDKTWSSLNTKNIINLPGVGPDGLKHVLEVILL